MEHLVKRFWWNAAWAGVIVLAAWLRFYGLRWGLPDSLHSYSYHPDEFLVISAALISVYLGRSFDPRFYNYPSLFIYLSALAMAVALGYGASATDTNVYLCARIVTALMGTAAVVVVGWAGTALYGRSVGLLAVLILCIAPLHVQHSHFATVDVPSTLSIAAALGFAGLVMKRGGWRDYIIGGVMVGFAAGTKYNAGFVVLSLAAAHFLRTGQKSGRRLLALFGCALGAFIVSTPGSILCTREFIGGIAYEMRHAATGHGLVFAGTGNGFVYTFASSLWCGLGPPLAALFVAAAAWALWKRDRTGLMILAFVVPYYALISLSQVRFARYSLPMFPAAALLSGWLMREWWRGLATLRFRAFKWVWVGICTLVILKTFVFTLMLDQLFTRPDPRDQAARWIFANIPKGSSIGVFDVPWFYSPPLTKNLGFGTLDQRREAMRKSPYKLTVFSDCEKPGSWWRDGAPPRWIVISDYEVESGRIERLKSDLSLVQRHYVRDILFRDPIIDMLRYYGLRRLPHDMRYVSPTITIYELKQ